MFICLFDALRKTIKIHGMWNMMDVLEENKIEHRSLMKSLRHINCDNIYINVIITVIEYVEMYINQICWSCFPTRYARMSFI